MIRSKYLLKVLIVVSISLLVTVVESGKTRNKVYRQNLWNPDPINRVSEGNDAPRFGELIHIDCYTKITILKLKNNNL